MANPPCNELLNLISVGLPLIIQPRPAHGSKARYRSAVRGWQAGSYLVLDTPVVNESLLPVVANMPCVVRFMHEGTAYAFYTTVIEVTASRSPFFRVMWPRKLEEVRVRRHERIRVAISCTIVGATGASVEGEIRDLSLGGCRLFAPGQYANGETVRLSAILPDGTVINDVLALVRAVESTAGGAFVGCQFLNLDENASQDIDYYVSTTLERQRRPEESNQFRVLIISNEPADVAILRTRMETADIEVVAAHGAVDGMFRLRLMPPHAVILRWGQPDLPGAEMCRLLRCTRGAESLPVFLYGTPEDSVVRKMAQDIGATGCIGSLMEVGDLMEALLAVRMEAKPESEPGSVDSQEVTTV